MLKAASTEKIISLFKRLPIGEKRELLGTLTEIVEKELKMPKADRSNIEARIQLIFGAMEMILGEPFIVNSRERKIVWARKLVAYELAKEGFTDSQMAPYLKRDRSTIYLMRRDVRDMMGLPNLYPEEMRAWNKLQEIIGNNH